MIVVRYADDLVMGFEREADLLAKALIPGESEWNSYARTFVAAVVRQCKAAGRPTRPSSGGWSPSHRGTKATGRCVASRSL